MEEILRAARRHCLSSDMLLLLLICCYKSEVSNKSNVVVMDFRSLC